ncbi:hypothetical protein HW090_17010 [Pseudomonas sp. ABC1]|uniref:hypothetical protein n=1 Tax=Pseudomonas sp. ABC1 TaxID=2748080 RepID=UPI0015C2D20D|nr:hypothetical protein [Pseudomonas sp. ABC1]QLF94798.1 hypothetical protein HW090_17010 [Pseudomonas sp. ABC1]
MDYFIIVTTTLAGLLFHAWLFFKFRRWADRDLALSLAGSDLQKRAWILERLEEARSLKVKRAQLQSWLETRVQDYPGDERT